MIETNFPIPLRPGLIVQIRNLPHDLTKQEAERIAAIVLAHAVVENEPDAAYEARMEGFR